MVEMGKMGEGGQNIQTSSLPTMSKHLIELQGRALKDGGHTLNFSIQLK